MKLLCDEYLQVYVWVDDHDEDIEISPHFDYEDDAVQWRERMNEELKRAKSQTGN